MAFEDIASRLAQVGAGWTIGTLERERADREEAQNLVQRAVQFGAQGVDYAPFIGDDQVRPANRQLLDSLIGQSNVSGALQAPFRTATAITAQREQTRLQSQEDQTQARLDQADENARLRDTRARTRSLRTLDANAWNELRDIIRQEIEPDIASILPDVFTTDAQGRSTVTRQEDLVTLGQIRRAIERRLPQDLPNNLMGIQQTVRQIWEQQVRPGLNAQASTYLGGTLGIGRARTFTYQDRGNLPASTTATQGSTDLDQPGSVTPTRTAATIAGQAAQTVQANEQLAAERIRTQYSAPISQASREFDIPEDVIAAQLFAESRGQPNAVGPQPRDGGPPAVGLMQVRPGTYNEVAGRIQERRGINNPDANVRVGVGYMREMLNRYQGHYGLALAAYNWGQGNVDRMLARVAQNPNTQWSDIEARLPAETRNYIARIGRAVGGWTPQHDEFTNQRPAPVRPNVQVASAARGAEVDLPPRPAPNRPIPQIHPTPVDAANLQTYITGLEQTARRFIQGTTDFSQRATARQRAIDVALDNVASRFPQYRDWVRSELERRLRNVR